MNQHIYQTDIRVVAYQFTKELQYADESSVLPLDQFSYPWILIHQAGWLLGIALLGLLSGLDQLKKFNHLNICGLIPLISQKCKLFRGQTKLSLMNPLGKRKNSNTTEIQQNHLHIAVAAQAWSISWAMCSVQNFGINH